MIEDPDPSDPFVPTPFTKATDAICEATVQRILAEKNLTHDFLSDEIAKMFADLTLAAVKNPPTLVALKGVVSAVEGLKQARIVMNGLDFNVAPGVFTYADMVRMAGKPPGTPLTVTARFLPSRDAYEIRPPMTFSLVGGGVAIVNAVDTSSA